MPHRNKEYQFKALSDIWTGDGSQKSGRLILTGLLGSIRWWFEVLVRGLGGSACDPTKTQCKDNTHCVACELFGCTGWARKFRFEVLNDKGDVQQNQIKKDDSFILRFIPLRPIRPEEWVLLETSLRLIAEYGAIGGKTVFKPSEQNKKVYHNDYGLIKLEESQEFTERLSPDKLEDYLSKWKGPKIDDGEFAWASLQNFWFVEGKYLTRKNTTESTFNRVIGREEQKNNSKKISNRHYIDFFKSSAAHGPAKSIFFDSATSSSSVTDTWAGGGISGFFDIFLGGASANYHQSTEKFASSKVTVKAEFKHVLPVKSFLPGDWFSSSFLNYVYKTKDKRVWPAGDPVTWESTFGSSGNMQRYIEELVVVDGIDITVTSSASYSAAEQEDIRARASAGIWPFFRVSASGGYSSATTFSDSGTMTTRTTCPEGNPAVFGMNVRSIESALI